MYIQHNLTQPLQLCFYISQVLEHACPLAEIPGIESPEFERPREAKRGPGEVLKNPWGVGVSGVVVSVGSAEM